MKEYEVLRTFWFGGRRYQPGEKVKLTDRAAINLVRAGKVESVVLKQNRKRPKKEGGEK